MSPILALVTTALFAAAAPAPRALDVHPAHGGGFDATFATMGTRADLRLDAPDEPAARAAALAARDELDRLEAMMSEWRPESPLSAINAAAGKAPVEVPAELYTMIARALEIARLSGGTFDPSWAAMKGVWKFGDAQDGSVPDAATIERTRRLVNHADVVLDPDKQSVSLKREGMALGLGGIAKGYAVDRVVALLRARGLRNFTVKVGGDLYASGHKEGARPWSVGVQDPRDKAKIFAALELTDAAFSTSGDYERAFVKDGVRYHHIIDPRTGRPATASRSVTARCKDAWTADAVTKPVFVLGPEAGVPFATKLGCDVVIVDAANKVWVSPGLASLRWTPPTP